MKAEFSRRITLLETQYSALTEPQSGKNVDGTRTRDENIIDNAAIKGKNLGVFCCFISSVLGSFLAYQEDLKKRSLASESGHVPGYADYTPEEIFYIGYGIVSFFVWGFNVVTFWSG